VPVRVTAEQQAVPLRDRMAGLVDSNPSLANGGQGRVQSGTLWNGPGGMESDARYYRRRAVEERMAAQRAVTETARAWHAKLAADYLERATASPQPITA
jgi:hypothetical protein